MYDVLLLNRVFRVLTNPFFSRVQDKHTSAVRGRECMRACARAFVCVCVCVCVCACVRACVRACVLACVCVCGGERVCVVCAYLFVRKCNHKLNCK